MPIADDVKPGTMVEVKSGKPVYHGKAIFIGWPDESKKTAIVALGNGKRITVDRSTMGRA